MSELSDLVGVLGAIDDHVVGHPDLIEQVSQLLCPYRYGAAGWFPIFQRWVAERPTPDDSAHLDIPGLDDALGSLSVHDELETEPQDPGLRLVTLAVLGRVMDAYGPGGSSSHLTRNALTVPSLANGDGEKAELLLQLLTDTKRFADSNAWDDMMQQAESQGLIQKAAVLPLRCRGEVVQVNLTGHAQPATAIQTKLLAPDLTFNDATAFLDPAQWPHCCSSWCRMKRGNDAADGTQRYEEVIGIACPTPLLTTCLGFKKVAAPKVAVVAYHLSPPTTPDCPGDGEVLVDEGSIEVRDLAPHGVSVTTTKRVLFQSVPPGALAMFSCIFGYSDMGDLLVYNCARRKGATPAPVKKATKKAAKGPKAAKAPKSVKTPKPPKFEGDKPPSGAGKHESTEVITDLAKLAKDCVTDSSASLRANIDKAVTGKYSTQHAASDLATVLRRTARDIAKAIDVGARGTAIAKRAPDPEPPAEPEEAP